MRGHPVDKDALAAQLAPMRTLFCKSLVARSALTAGHVIQATDLAAKKPGTGLAVSRLQEFVGRRLRRSVQADQLLQEADFDLAPTRRRQIVGSAHGP